MKIIEEISTDANPHSKSIANWFEQARIEISKLPIPCIMLTTIVTSLPVKPLVMKTIYLDCLTQGNAKSTSISSNRTIK